METLRIYGPGGPYRPMSECALAFGRAGIRTRVALRHPDLLAAAWRWLKRQRPL